VERVSGSSVPDHLGVDARASSRRALRLLEDQHAGTLRQHESVALRIERPARGLRVRVLGERLHLGERRDGQRQRRGLGAANDRELDHAVADHPESLAHRVGAGGACGHGAEVRTREAEAHRDVAGGSVGHQRRNHERAHAARSLLQQNAVLLEKRLDAADAGGDHDATTLRRDLRGTRVLPGQLRSRDGEVRHAVGVTDLLRIEPAGGVEAGHLSGEVHDEVGGVEVLDLPDAVAARGQPLPEVLDAGSDRRHRPDAGDDDVTISH
jgi:hypothetical protein